VAQFFGQEETLVRTAEALLEDDKRANVELVAPHEWLHSGTMEKKVMTSKGIEWQARFAVLRLSFLYYHNCEDFWQDCHWGAHVTFGRTVIGVHTHHIQ